MKRRHFLHGAVTAAGTLFWPRSVGALSAALERARASDFWEIVRAAYLIPADRIYLNVGTLGPQPRVVVDAVIEHTRRVAMTWPPGIDWDGLKSRVGAFLGADPAGLVFPRNTTEAMNFVANGLELGPADEVLTTTHEHIGGLCCWQLIAKRRGTALRQLDLPVPATSAAELVDVFRRAITPRTRVISVSHVTFTNGTLMPVREIAALCRERGIICVIDGAHPPGMMRIGIDAIGADFYASSPHKWLCAPQGSGLLWMAEPWRTRLWPTLASGDWDRVELGAQRFNHLGSLDESRLAGLDAALRFQQAIGIDRIEARVRELDTHLRTALEQIPGLRVLTPADPELGIGLVAFRPERTDALELQRRLGTANIRTRVVSEYGYGWMRLSPHIYNGFGEIDTAVELIRRAL